MVHSPHINVHAWTGLSQSFRKRDGGSLFRTCLATGYVPALWCQTKVAFIHKPGRSSYCGPRDFRPISLTSFLFKTIERLVDKFLRDEMLVVQPLRPYQHAYHAGKCVETAFHQFVVQVDKSLDQQFTLGIFLDREGAFDNISYDSMWPALANHRVHQTIVRCFRATLEGQLETAAFGGVFRRVAESRGRPHGGLSPLLWCLVVNELIVRLNEESVYAQRYANDMFSSGGKIPKHGIRSLHTAELWCCGLGVSVNPDKTGLVVFTRKRKLTGFFEPRLFGKTLQRSMSVKDLGVILDSRLTWKEHVNVKGRGLKLDMGLWCDGVSETQGGSLALRFYHQDVRHLHLCYGELAVKQPVPRCN